MTQTSKQAKAKRNRGKRAELDVVHLVDGKWYKDLTAPGSDHKCHFPLKAQTGRQHRGGPDSPDVIHNMTGYHWEVTVEQACRPWTAAWKRKLSQACRDAGPDVPILWWREKGAAADKWLVTVFTRTDLNQTARLVLCNPPATIDGAVAPVVLHYRDLLRLLDWSEVQ